jgi:ribosomal protein L40E
MILINYKDPTSGNTISPILNLNDSVINGVLAGINELSADDLILEKIQDSKIISDVKYCFKCGYKIPKEAAFCSSCGTKQM